MLATQKIVIIPAERRPLGTEEDLVGFTSTPLNNDALLQTSTSGRHASVVINRDFLVNKIYLSTRDENYSAAEVAEDVLTAVRACTMAGIAALRGLGVSKNLVLQHSHRWYDVHVPAGYAEQAANALQAAELHGDTGPLAVLTQTLESFTDQLAHALPDNDRHHPRAKTSTRSTRRERTAARRRELAEFGNLPPFNICMFPLLGEDDRNRLVLPARTARLRQVTAKFGRQFRREAHYDLPAFEAEDPDQHGVLLLSKQFTATFPIAAGAAGLSQGSRWCLDWVWLHPYERGSGYIDRAWDQLEELYGRFTIDGTTRQR
jgi:hypothetical protein